MEGNRFAVSAEERSAAENVVKASARSLGVAHDPAAALSMLDEHELELRKNDRWECGWFAYDGGEDLVHGRGATPAEAIAAAASALRTTE